MACHQFFKRILGPDQKSFSVVLDCCFAYGHDKCDTKKKNKTKEFDGTQINITRK